MARLPRALSPLRHPGYRALAASLALQLFSSGLWIVALVWQVVALGGGPTQLSWVTTASACALLVSTLLGGVLADRVPQRHLLMVVAVGWAVTSGIAAVLSLTGELQWWHLVAVATGGGLTSGMYYPAYSALLPTLVDEADLLPANGLEGVIRPILLQAAGPAVAGLVVAAGSPGAALVLTSATSLGAGLVLLAIPARRIPVEGERTSVAADAWAGFLYMTRTPWLLATLVFASLMVLLTMGPLEVLAPFAIVDRAAGGPAEHSLVLATFGIGGAVGSLLVASHRMPRRYLSVMIMAWGLGCLPLAAFGLVSQVWVMAAATFVMGLTFQGATVIWGTLLQRRVPRSLLGRVSSLDFFVSLAFMPVSMALAGPVSELVGLTTTFVVAATVPTGLAIVAIVWAKLTTDEIEHPLDDIPLTEEAVAVPR